MPRRRARGPSVCRVVDLLHEHEVEAAARRAGATSRRASRDLGNREGFFGGDTAKLAGRGGRRHFELSSPGKYRKAASDYRRRRRASRPGQDFSDFRQRAVGSCEPDRVPVITPPCINILAAGEESTIAGSNRDWATERRSLMKKIILGGVLALVIAADAFAEGPLGLQRHCDEAGQHGQWLASM